MDYSRIPQRLHKYPASARAQEVVHKSITMDTLFSGVVPIPVSYTHLTLPTSDLV